MADHPAAPHHGTLPAPSLFSHISHPKKRGFLTAFAESGQIKQASTATAVDHTNHYYWVKTDPVYATAFEQAKAIAAASLEDEAIRRARDGVKRVIYHEGEPVGEQLVYSDVLLIFLLKGMLPQKYGNARADREQAQTISDLLKAVLLELAQHQPVKDVTPGAADWAPLAAGAESPATAAALPAPPAPDETD